MKLKPNDIIQKGDVVRSKHGDVLNTNIFAGLPALNWHATRPDPSDYNSGDLFETTLTALQQCHEYIHNNLYSNIEETAREQLIDLCAQIAEEMVCSLDLQE